MKIQYCSDLHLDKKLNDEYWRINKLEPVGDVLIIAGDLFSLNKDNIYDHPFIDDVSKNFKEVFILPGNHEFYGGLDVYYLEQLGEIFIRNNVRICYNKSYIFDNVKLIFSTLWGFLPLNNCFNKETNIPDFKLIKYKDKIIDFSAFNSLHLQSIQFIQEECTTEGNYQNVVVTHHSPIKLNHHSVESNNIFSGAFSTDQTSLIEILKPNYWIFGHMHLNFVNPIIINQTVVLCNQHGYIHEGQGKGFRKDAVIEVL